MNDELIIEIANEQSACAIQETLIREVVAEILSGEGVAGGQISVALVDDPTIHEVNRQHLNHDYPTDVISFVFDRDGTSLDGEVIASADTACATAKDLGWPAENELLLYVVHGTLHLVGYDDQTESDREEMRGREAHYLARFGMTAPWQDAEE